MTRDHVKCVLLELGWQSLKMLGRCIDTQMRAFRDALSNPLTKSEDFYFSQVFLANPAFGGLPLLLLHDRYDELNAAIVNVWNNPGSQDAIAVLHQVMAYFAEFMGHRREADKIYKRRSLARNKNEKVATESQLDEETHNPSTTKEEQQFLEIARAVAVRHGFDCEFGDWEAELISSDDTVIQFKLRRAEPKRAKVFTVSRSEFEEEARKLYVDD